MQNHELAISIINLCNTRQWRLATAESCTGGMIAATITDIAGSSAIFLGSVVAYDNAVKEKLLNVPKSMLETVGAVSAEVARAMAEGARDLLGSDLAVAVTGIAGPGGGSAEKPVGLVYLALASRWGDTRHVECRFGEIGRAQVRIHTVEQALNMVNEYMMDVVA